MVTQYELDASVSKLINADSVNEKYWNDCKELLKSGKKVCNIFYITIKCVLLATVIYRRFWMELNKFFNVYVAWR